MESTTSTDTKTEPISCVSRIKLWEGGDKWKNDLKVMERVLHVWTVERRYLPLRGWDLGQFASRNSVNLSPLAQVMTHHPNFGRNREIICDMALCRATDLVRNRVRFDALEALLNKHGFRQPPVEVCVPSAVRDLPDELLDELRLKMVIFPHPFLEKDDEKEGKRAPVPCTFVVHRSGPDRRFRVGCIACSRLPEMDDSVGLAIWNYGRRGSWPPIFQAV